MSNSPKQPLSHSFFARSALDVAPDLLGRTLIRQLENGQQICGRIVETEAYMGKNDQASHASRGMTPRNAIMFGPAGHAYVYLIYGIYNCLNVVTGPEGEAQAVLIRALALPGAEGPGKLCRKLNITRDLNDIDICMNQSLWISKDNPVTNTDIVSTTRIGVSYAGKDAQKPWRFYVKSCGFISKP